MSLTTEQIKSNLLEKGYCVVPNVLNEEDIEEAKETFFKWQTTIPDHDYQHNFSSHGIYKFWEVGHARHAWLIRTNPKVQQVFKDLWDTDDLITSFDGSCYIPKTSRKNDNVWLHTDQAPGKAGLRCYQGLVSLTDNTETSLVVYEGTHLEHQSHFEERGINHKTDWQKIDLDYVRQNSEKKRVMNIPKGSLALWDSRTFHQNQYGKPGEERIVQYVCFLPKSHPDNKPNIIAKRRKYFNERRTTSHWPCPIRVNSLQMNFRNKDPRKTIDYSKLEEPELDDLMEEIEKLL
jgi:hypothetical protein